MAADGRPEQRHAAFGVVGLVVWCVVWLINVGLWALTGFRDGISGLIDMTIATADGVTRAASLLMGAVLGALLVLQLFLLPPVMLFAVIFALLQHRRGDD